MRLSYLVKIQPVHLLKIQPAPTISLTNGILESAAFEDVPFVRFRKQMSTRSRWLTSEDYQNKIDVSYSKESTVFIVRADAIVDFLSQFEVPEETVLQLRNR